MRIFGGRSSVGVLTAVALLTAACGGSGGADGDGEQDGGGLAAGICEVGDVDCIDNEVVDGDGAVDVPDDAALDEDAIDAAQARAEALLGKDEASLGDDVRVGRRGDETMMLTEDYVLGRMTVELDPDDHGVQRVTSVTVELPGGPQTVTR